MIVKSIYKIFAVLILSTALSQTVIARTYARIGYDIGGDKLQTPVETSKDINAGNGATIEFGFIDMKDRAMSSGRSTELSLGAKLEERGAGAASYEALVFGRLTLNAAHFLHNGRWRFGAGLSYHFGNTLFYDNAGDTETEAKFDAAAGVTVQIDRLFYDGLYRVGVKGIAIEYESEDSVNIDGSSIGFFAGMYF